MSTFNKEQLIEHLRSRIEHRKGLIASMHIDRGYRDYLKLELLSSEIALASLEAEPVAYMYKDNLHADARFSLHTRFGNWSQEDINEYEITEIPLYTAPPAPVSVPDAIEPTVESIKRILPTSNPDEYAACIGADMWNACRAAMLQGAENAESPTTMQTAPALDSSPKIAESPSGNFPVIPDAPHFREMRNSSTNNCRENAETSTNCPCCGRKPLKNKTCSVAGCDGKHVARGFCIKHYAIERKKDPSRRKSIRAADKRYRARKAAAPQQEVKP